MGVGGTPFTRNQLIGIGVLFVGFVLLAVALFTPWWVIQFKAGGFSQSQDIKPFTGVREGEDDLDTEAVLTGAFALVAMLGVLGSLLAAGISGFGRPLPILFHLVFPALAVLLGLTAVLYTMFAWPAEVNSGDSGSDVNFFDSIRGEGGSISFYGGIGWYFAIVGAILAPATNTILNLNVLRPGPREAQPVAQSPSPAPTFAAPAAPTHSSQPAPAASPPEPTTPARSSTAPVSSARRVAVKKPQGKKSE